jgi:raffinose/stachyose/melibiose transport system substrate-binding protein
LAGCGSKSGSDSSDNGTASATSAPKATEASSKTYNTKAIEGAGNITITAMVSGTATENDFYTDVLPKQVKAKWPNVTLEVTELPDDNYYTALKTKLSSGECPDMILVQPKYAGSNACYTLAKAGYLANLNDLSCLSLMGKLPENMTLDGTTYAVPNGVSILGTYYNKDVFKKYNLQEPKTWSDFLNVCKTLKSNGVQPIVMGDKDAYVLQFGLYQLACSEIYGKNAKYDDGLYTGDTKFTDKDTWDKVINMYKQLYDNKYIDASSSLGLSASQAIQTFIDGKAAMTFDGSFNASALSAKGAVSFERGYFPLPGDSADGKVYTAVCTSAGPAVYAKSKYIDECKEILDYWYDGQSDLWNAYVDSGKYVVTYGNGADKVNPLFQPFVDSLNNGEAFYWCNQAWPSGVADKMEELFYEMVGGQGIKADEVIKGMQESFDDLNEDQ